MFSRRFSQYISVLPFFYFTGIWHIKLIYLAFFLPDTHCVFFFLIVFNYFVCGVYPNFVWCSLPSPTTLSLFILLIALITISLVMSSIQSFPIGVTLLWFFPFPIKFFLHYYTVISSLWSLLFLYFYTFSPVSIALILTSLKKKIKKFKKNLNNTTTIKKN